VVPSFPVINVRETMAIIKKASITTPSDFILLLKFKTSLVAIIKDAKIQNCVIKIKGKVRSGMKAINLNNPGA